MRVLAMETLLPSSAALLLAVFGAVPWDIDENVIMTRLLALEDNQRRADARN